jgi:hypothetical protein
MDGTLRRAAVAMIKNHGPEAANIAMQRADNLRGDDLGASEHWERVARAVLAIERSAEAPQGSVHRPARSGLERTRRL